MRCLLILFCCIICVVGDGETTLDTIAPDPTISLKEKSETTVTETESTKTETESTGTTPISSSTTTTTTTEPGSSPSIGTESTASSIDTTTTTESSTQIPPNSFMTPKCTPDEKRKCLKEECPAGQILSNDLIGLGECCPKCVPLLGVKDECVNGDESKGICNVGLKCIEAKNHKWSCQKDGCLAWDCPIPDKNEDCINKPSCDPDGTYSAKQCKGQKYSGRCFCYNAEGDRIFGQEWLKQAENITCGCARKVDQLRNERQFVGDVTLHCDTTGDWESLQCDSGVCWCAEPHTGKPESMVVPQTMATILPCYDSKDPFYLRQCDSAIYAASQIAKLMKSRGTSYGQATSLFCDPDGSYGSYQISDSQRVFCSGQDNSQLGPWGGEFTKLSEINCNCARDSKVIYVNAGLTFTQLCSPSGNYKKLQLAEFEGVSKQYCCDDDGFPYTEPIPTDQELDCGADI